MMYSSHVVWVKLGYDVKAYASAFAKAYVSPVADQACSVLVNLARVAHLYIR